MSVFVGSGTNIKSDRTGFAVSTTNPGSAAEGDSYFNQTSNALNVHDGSDWNTVGGAGANFKAVASGTLSDGSTVVVNSDGTVGVVTQTRVAPSAGVAVTFSTSSATNYISATYDSTNGKIVVAYQDNQSNQYGHGTAVVGTISGNSITFGTPVIFQAANGPGLGPPETHIVSAYDSTNDKVVIAWSSGASSYHGKAIVGTVSGTSITFGSAVTFYNNNTHPYSVVYDSQHQKIVIVYEEVRAPSNSYVYYGTAIVGNVSGSGAQATISFGAKNTFKSDRTDTITATYDSTNQKVVIAYRDFNDNFNGKLIVGSVSSNAISFPGTETTFYNGDGNTGWPSYTSATYDSTNQKVVLAFQDNINSHGKVIVGTVSGNSISLGSTVTFNNAGTYHISAVYDSSNSKVVLAYRDGSNSNNGTAIVGTVVGTGITFGISGTFKTGTTDYISATYDSTNQKVVVAYEDSSNSDIGTASVITSLGSDSTNLTSSNFVGFSDGAYTNGQTATVQIAGSVDDAQVGLTTGQKYFVQNDGTLSTSAGNPSVEAGTAVSASKIIIKG